jgi:hypothetical protein
LGELDVPFAEMSDTIVDRIMKAILHGVEIQTTIDFANYFKEKPGIDLA